MHSSFSSVSEWFIRLIQMDYSFFFDWFTVSEPLGGRMVLFLKHSSIFKWKHRIQNSTCCHDNTSQNFPSCVWRREVVSELAEFVHYQTRDGICKNLVKSIQMSDFTQTVMLTSITHEHTSVHHDSAIGRYGIFRTVHDSWV